MKMRDCAAALLLSVCAAGVSTGQEQPRHWKLVDRVTYDWRGDSDPYEFVMSIPDNHDAAGDYTQLRIIRGGHEIFRSVDPDGLAKVKEALLSPELVKASGRNLLSTGHLLMLPGLTGRSRFPLLMLFGWGYGSGPGSFHVVALDDDGLPKEILSLANFDLTGVIDLDHDGVPELVGRKCLAQEWGSHLLTYAPFLVYRFGATATSLMVLDTALSRAFNEDHAYGWAGSECNEDLAIVLHPPGGGKPRIMPAREAEALYK